jgi:hypothetical protein
MTALALDLRDSVPAVAEKYEFGYFVDAARRNVPLRHIHMAYFALLRLGETCKLRPLGILVTRYAAQLQRCVLFMIERLLIGGPVKR